MITILSTNFSLPPYPAAGVLTHVSQWSCNDPGPLKDANQLNYCAVNFFIVLNIDGTVDLDVSNIRSHSVYVEAQVLVKIRAIFGIENYKETLNKIFRDFNYVDINANFIVEKISSKKINGI